MRRRIQVLAMTVLLSVVAGRDGQAATYLFSGHSCQVSGDVFHDHTTVGVLAFNGARIFVCPIVGNEDDDLDIAVARVNIIDGNDSSNYLGTFSCHFFVNTLTGSYTASSTKYSCDTAPAGGCTTDDPDHVTAANTDDYLNWTDPVGTSTINNIGTYGFYCSVPIQDWETTANSFLRRYYIDQLPR